MKTPLRLIAAGWLSATCLLAADYPAPVEGDFVLRDFKFTSGVAVPELRIHYRTIGALRRDAGGKVTNAVLITHGTTGSGVQFLAPTFAPELFGAGQPLDATKYFIVLPDSIGHGKSGKPSDGLRAKFPHYGYSDMVEAQYRLLTEGLGVNHARLIMGTSMGHPWVRREKRTRVWRRSVAIRSMRPSWPRPRPMPLSSIVCRRIVAKK